MAGSAKLDQDRRTARSEPCRRSKWNEQPQGCGVSGVLHMEEKLCYMVTEEESFHLLSILKGRRNEKKAKKTPSQLQDPKTVPVFGTSVMTFNF